MSASGLDVFDKSLQTTNIWLKEIMETVGPDRQVAWRVLNVVLHRLRDQLPVDLAAHLGGQLPLIVRGAYYDQFDPANQPADCDRIEEFVERIADDLAQIRPVDPKAAVHSVFGVLSHHLPDGQIAKVRGALPRSLRASWEGLTDGRPRARAV
jgi:uncharacterized protein (DUF2267 family)